MSTANKQAIKVALSLTLAIVSALALGWDKVYWSALTVIIMANNETYGHSIRKGRHRVLGTIFGIILAFVALQLFSQAHIAFIACYLLFAATMCYLADDQYNGYLFRTIFTVTSIICFSSGFNGDLSFNYAILRIQETLLGVFCFSAVFTFIWPVRTEQVFFNGLAKLLAEAKQQAKLLEQHLTKSSDLAGEPAEAIQELDLAALASLKELLSLPLSDSYLLRYQQAHWQHFIERLELSLLQLNQAITMANRGQIPSQEVPVLVVVLQRFIGRLERLLLAVDKLDVSVLDKVEDALSLTDQASSDFAQQLLAADSYAAEALQRIRGAYRRRWRHNGDIGEKTQPWLKRLANDVERRMLLVYKVVFSIGVGFALWIFIPLPGSFIFPMLSASFSFNLGIYPSEALKPIFWGFIISATLVLTQFVLLLPTLSEIWQLAAFYFINTLVIWRGCSAPKLKAYQMIGTQMLLSLTMGAMSATPHYDMNSPFTMVLLILISLMTLRFSVMFIEQLLPLKSQQA
ncbi:FUSC family protein [Agarivorans sp.]|uniref:FUSC family protein n=1 Tax=Agarivorans sp. TaxID=1872412 RepID=UPI003D07CC20